METKPGVCDWCDQPVLLVLREYPADCGGGSFWSVENCPCINGLRRGIRHGAFSTMGRRTAAHQVVERLTPDSDEDLIARRGVA